MDSVVRLNFARGDSAGNFVAQYDSFQWQVDGNIDFINEVPNRVRSFKRNAVAPCAGDNGFCAFAGNDIAEYISDFQIGNC